MFHVTAAGTATCAVCQIICYHLSTDYLLGQNTELGTLLSFQYMKKYMLLAHVFLWILLLFPLAKCLWRKRARLHPINWQKRYILRCIFLRFAILNELMSVMWFKFFPRILFPITSSIQTYFIWSLAPLYSHLIRNFPVWQGNNELNLSHTCYFK